jgi:hypothetical protein
MYRRPPRPTARCRRSPPTQTMPQLAPCLRAVDTGPLIARMHCLHAIVLDGALFQHVVVPDKDVFHEAVARHLPSQRCTAALPVARTSLPVPCTKLNGRSSKQAYTSAIGSLIRGTQICHGSLKVSELHSPNLRNIGTPSFLVYKAYMCI